jgi:two-component system, NarL family, nitrate/nitrite response regulator NarL
MPVSAPASPTIRLMLVDDHPLVRDGLRARLDRTAGLQVVGEAGTADEALTQARHCQPDLVLMDIGLPGTNGIAATRQLRAALPHVRVLMLTMYDSAQTRREALAAGASGYLLKDSPAEDIVSALHRVMSGQALGTDAQAPPVDDEAHGPGRNPLAEATPAPRPHAALTPREREVLALIAEGLSSREIGVRLDMSARTVETHRTHLRRKLNLSSPAALVRHALLQHPKG